MDIYKQIFDNMRIVRKRDVFLADTEEKYEQDQGTVRRPGFEIAGDKVLRNPQFKKYAAKRMNTVGLLRPNVKYLTFKHANFEEKKSMCLPFQLSDSQSYFYDLLLRHFKHFDNLQIKRPNLKYLGQPGRQGVAVLIRENNIEYVFKLAHSVGHKGFGKATLTRGQRRKNRNTYGKYENDGGPLGFISQAKFQMISAMHNCTVPVYACGVQNDTDVAEALRIPVSFIVMPPLKMLAHDYIKEKLTMYPKSVVIQHFVAKYYNLMLKMDTDVGILHNDTNNLNVMVDEEDDVVLIDFDRSVFTSHVQLQKRGLYTNLDVVQSLALILMSGYIRGVTSDEFKEAFQKLYSSAKKARELNMRKQPAEVIPLDTWQRIRKGLGYNLKDRTIKLRL
jgi:tRNA A-37 threonylcarbamoyl transferase component Bud32